MHLRGVVMLSICTLVSVYVSACTPQPLPTEVILERDGSMQFWSADMLVSNAELPPPDTAAWRRIRLPDRWTDPTRRGLLQPRGWYRLELPASGTKRERYSVYLMRVNMNAAVYFNGDFVGDGGSFEEPIARNWNRPLLFELPASLWRSERNTLHIHLAGYPHYNTLGPVIVGPRSVLMPLWDWRVLLQNRVSEVLFVLTVLISLIGLGFWLRTRESIYLLFAASSIAWSLYSAHMFVRDIWIPARLWWALVHTAVDWWVVLLVLFAHRLLGWQRPRVELGLVAVGCVIAIAYQLADLTIFYIVNNVGHLLALLLGIYLTIALTVASRRTRRTEIWLFALGMWVIILLGLHDLFLNAYNALELWRRGALFMLNFGAPFLFAVLIWHLSGRFVRALQEAQQLNAELENRVAQTRAELEQSYVGRSALLRREAAAGERERIYRDLHDDVGAKLLSLVYAADKPATATLAREALQDLRDIVSQGVLEARPLADLLSDIRAEVEERCGGADWQLEWRQPDALPDLELNPTQVFHLQRILREVVSNALRHSGGSRLLLLVDWQAPVLTVQLDDDGCGFGAEGSPHRALAHGSDAVLVTGAGANGPTSGGRGLRNIRQRAQELGGIVMWLPAVPHGSRFQLQLPLGPQLAPPSAPRSPESGGGFVVPSA